MAGGVASQLTALCAVASFLWLAYSFERHTLSEKPRLSSFLILLISGLVSFGVSFFSSWLPGANGRFDDESGLLTKASHPTGTLPRRPRRFFIPCLVFCVVIRLELFHRVTFDLQCSSPGIESFLPLLLLAYELMPGRRPRSDYEQIDELDETLLDEFKEWLAGSKATLALSATAFTYGVYLCTTGNNRSTFFCASTDRSPVVVLIQYLALLLDASIAVLLWRVLAWARTTKSRLKTLGGILIASSFMVGLLILATQLFARVRPRYPGAYYSPFTDIHSLYLFDVFNDSLTFATLFISSSLVMCEDSPATLAAIFAFLCGLLAASHRVAKTGTFENVARSATLLSLYLLCVSFVTFTYANNMRSVTIIRRGFLAIALLSFLFGTTTYSLLMSQTLDNHPLEKLVYDTRIEADRWLVHATVSQTLNVAVKEYQERHFGRSPPAGFDAWYQFAVEKDSAIIDHFEQIDKDILPFWGMKPQEIRQRVARLSTEPDLAILKVQNGVLSYKQEPGSPAALMLDDLVEMIQPFAAHLADMELPVNLLERPRVIVPWDDQRRLTEAGKQTKFKLPGRSLLVERNTPPMAETTPIASAVFTSGSPGGGKFTSARTLRKLVASTCPTGSRARSGVHWNIRDFCSPCASPQSDGQFLKDWERSTDICHQPDMLRLHGFHTTPRALKPWDGLLPVFSRSKTDNFNDILIPLNQPHENQTDDTGARFTMKKDRLYWRGKVGRGVTRELLHGGHQERLAHLINNASASDEVTVLVPTRPKNQRLAYEKVHAADLNAALPFDIGMSDYRACRNGSCDAALREFGMKTPSPSLEHRYVLLVDDDNGPPDQTLRTLRSTSVPFVASVFKEWYWERLMPWIHFVPVDLRFHGLHSTLAYFTGLKGRGKVGGRDVDMDAHLDDGMWIAEQGRRWAERAIRREDMQIYLFRLLLEWGRVIDDNRDDLGFVLDG